MSADSSSQHVSENPLVAAALAAMTPPSLDELLETIEAHEQEAARIKKMVKAYAKSKGDKKSRVGSSPKGETPIQVTAWNAFVASVREESGVKVDSDGNPVMVKDKETGEFKTTFNMSLQEALVEAGIRKKAGLWTPPAPSTDAIAAKAAAAAAKAAAKAAEREAAKAEKALEREAAKAARQEAAALLKADKAAEREALKADKVAEREVLKAEKAAEREAAKADKAVERELAKAAKLEAAAMLKAAKAEEREAAKAEKAAAAAAEREAKKEAAAAAREVLKAQKEAEKLAIRQAKIVANAGKTPAPKPVPAPVAEVEEEEDDLSLFTFKGVNYWRDAAGFCWLKVGDGLGPYAGKYDPVADKIDAKAKAPAVHA
jgi:hypothetical protein